MREGGRKVVGGRVKHSEGGKSVYIVCRGG